MAESQAIASDMTAFYAVDWREGSFGNVIGSPGVVFSRTVPTAIVEVIVRRGADGERALKHLPAPGTVIHKKNSVLIWTAPRRFVAASSRDDVQTLSAKWSKSAGAGGYVTDLSQARWGVRIAGEAAVELLAKGCPIDVERMGANSAAATVCEGMPVLLHGVPGGALAFDLYIMRSYASSMFHWLTRSAAEFGYELR